MKRANFIDFQVNILNPKYANTPNSYTAHFDGEEAPFFN